MARSPFGARAAVVLVATFYVIACQSGTEDPNVGANGEGGENQGGSNGGSAGSAEAGSMGSGTGGNAMASTMGGTTVPAGGKGGSSGSGGVGGTANVAGQGGTVVGAGGAAAPIGGAGGTVSVMGTCKTAAVCDDFEAGVVGQAPASPWTRSGATKMAVSEDKAFSGKRSVKIEIAAGDGGEALLSRKDPNLFPVKDQLYMRMMVFLDRAPAGSGLHWAFMQVQGAARDANNKVIGLASYGVGGHPSQFQSIYLLPTNSNGLNDCWDYSSRSVPTGKWVCMEWHLDVPKDAQEVWADGQMIPELSFTTQPSGSTGCLNPQTGGKWLIPDISFARVGWIHYHTANAQTVWIDDVVMDKQRVGCPKP